LGHGNGGNKRPNVLGDFVWEAAEYVKGVVFGVALAKRFWLGRYRNIILALKCKLMDWLCSAGWQ
jgi:hypothetical protein